MKLVFKKLSAGLVALVFSSVVLAAAGDLDTTFGGGDGWVSTGFEGIPLSDDALTSVKQSDGKLVVAGSALSGSYNDFALARYNSDGSLDTTFNGTGKVTTAVGNFNDVAYSVIQQSDGKLVAAGSSNALNDDFALVRYNSDGSLDTTFNGTGKVTTGIGGANDNAYSVIQQSDGKLVAAGYTNNGTNGDFALVRYNSDGSLDTTFNTTGKVTTAIGSGHDTIYSVIQQSNGKLVVTGYTYNGSNNDFALARYNSDGSLDTTFNTTGKLTSAIGSGNDTPRSVIQQSDGKLLVVGTAFTGSNEDFALVRYNIDGSIDVSTTTAVGSTNDAANSVVQQSDGKLVVAGYAIIGGNYDFVLVRYNNNLSLDTTFNSTGKVTTTIGSANDTATSVIQQSDGKLVAVGYTYNGANDDFAVVRYLANGSLDTTFNSTGKVITNFGSSQDFARSIIQQGDGKLVAAGYSKIGSNLDVALTRYNLDGSIDTSFDGDGKVTTAIGAADDTAWSSIQQVDGKIVAVGYSFNGSNDDVLLVRYNSNGSLDTAFNGTGKVTTAVGSARDTAYGVTQQADGKLVTVGLSVGTNEDFLVVRYNSNGTLDTTFNGTGKVVTPIGTGNDQAWGVIQQADGKLVVVGHSNNASGYSDFAVVRYNSNGTLDAGFNGTGKVVTALATGSDYARSVLQDSNGKLVVGGSANTDAGYSDFALVRYSSNGALDTTFNGTGTVTTKVTGNAIHDFSDALIRQTDGKLVLAGYTTNGSYYDFSMVRYNTNGSLDTSFSGDGKLTFAAAAGDDQSHSFIMQLDGKLVVAGHSTLMPTGQEFVVARFESGMCFAGKYWNGTTCVNADAGNYVPSAGATSQTACVAGTYQSLTGQSSCNVCSLATWSDSSATTCYTDTDGDHVGDATDSDDDNDGMPDAWENQYGFNPLVNDANGDHDSDGISNLQEFANGSNPTSAVTLKNDYTDNSIAGWYWKGQSNGMETYNEIWQLTFPLYSSNWAVPNRFYPPPFSDQANWDIVTTGDFNRDGDADILWRHNTLATWQIWQTKNGQRDAITTLADFDLAHVWQVIGAGDTDKDSDDDVILNNTATGEVMIWEMQNYVIVNTHSIGTKPGYTLNRIGDFNKDGDVDLLFRQNSGDVLVTWELQANAFVTERALANTGTDWNPVCTGDFDGDRDDDIMLMNSVTTQEKWFVMENYTRTQAFGSLNTGFEFQGCGDYDGDGDADIKSQRISDSMNRIVLQTNVLQPGLGVIKQTVYTNPYGNGYGFVYRGNSN